MNSELEKLDYVKASVELILKDLKGEIFEQVKKVNRFVVEG